MAGVDRPTGTPPANCFYADDGARRLAPAGQRHKGK